MATLDEMLDFQKITRDYSEDPGAAAEAESNVIGLEKEKDKALLQQTLEDRAVQGRARLNAKTAAVDEFMKTLQGQAAEVKNVIQTSGDGKQVILAQAEKLALQTAEEQKKVLQARQLAAQKKADDAAGDLNRRSINTSDPNALANIYAIQNTEDIKRYFSLKDEVDKVAATSFFEDPAGWILGQFTVGDQVAQANSLASTINTKNNYIRDAAGVSAAIQNANAGKIASVSAAETEALANIAAIDAIKESGKAQIAAAEARGATAKELYNINANIANQLVAQENRGYAEQERMFAAEDRRKRDAEAREQKILAAEQRIEEAKSRGLARQETIARTQLLNLQTEREMADKAEKKKTKEERDTEIRNAGAAAGISIPDEAAFRRMTKKEQDILDTLVKSGGRILGDTPSEVLEVAKYIQRNLSSPLPENATPGQIATKEAVMKSYPAPQVELIRGMEKMWTRAYNLEMKKPGAKDATARAAADSYVKQEFENQRLDPTSGSGRVIDGEGNVYGIPPLREYVAVSPSLSGTPVGKIVTDLATKAPDLKINEKTVLLALGKEVYNKRMNISDAAKALSDFYSKAVANVNRTMDYEKFGMKKLEDIPVTVAGQRLNLLKPEDATIAIIRESYRMGSRSVNPFLPGAASDAPNWLISAQSWADLAGLKNDPATQKPLGDIMGNELGN